MIIHHIAIATHDIQASAEVYKQLGYKIGNVVDDDVRRVRICFVSLNGVCFELVQPLSVDSPVSTILKKSAHDSLYHVCYQVADVPKSIKHFSDLGFICISRMEPAPAIDGKRVVFMFHKKLGLIELVEE